MTDLLTCPFCGTQPEVNEGGGVVTIHCANDECDVGCETSATLKSEAVGAWNKRASGKPVAYRYMTATGRWAFLDQSWEPADPHVYDHLEPVYAGSATAADQPRPVAYAVFADNGNLRLWTSVNDAIEAFAERTGTVITPLYAAPPEISAPVKPVAYVNGDDLANMLDDRTATIQGVKDGWRRTPLYASPSRARASNE